MATVTAFAPMAILVILLNLALFIAIPVLLQVFLSTRQNKWLGLILPILSLLSSLVLILNMVYIAHPRTYFVIALVALLPPAVLLLVYWLCRRHLKRKTVRDEMAQMNIQDL